MVRKKKKEEEKKYGDDRKRTSECMREASYLMFLPPNKLQCETSRKMAGLSMANIFQIHRLYKR